MKEMIQLEAQLRSWTPRRPALKLEPHLMSCSPRRFLLPKLVSVFAPAAVCLLVTLAGLKQFDPPGLGSGNAAALVAQGLSNQHYAPYVPGNSQSSANRWDTFEWTNRGYSQSSMRSFTPPKATDLQ